MPVFSHEVMSRGFTIMAAGEKVDFCESWTESMYEMSHGCTPKGDGELAKEESRRRLLSEPDLRDTELGIVLIVHVKRMKSSGSL